MPFITFTKENGADQSTIFLNVDQIKYADFKPDKRLLKVYLQDKGEFEIRGDEAEAAAKVIREHV